MGIVKGEALNAVAQKREFIFPKILATIHTKDADYDLTHVTNFRISRHFTDNITDVFHIEFLSTLGFIKDTLFTNKDNLEISIVLNYDNVAIKEYIFKLIITSKFPSLNSGKAASTGGDKLDTQSLVTVKGQCIDPLVLKLKNVFVSGIYHKYKLGYFIRSLLNYEFSKMEVAGRLLDYKINVYEPDNQAEYYNILIKPYSKLINVPYMLHHDMFGLYLYGFNLYFSMVNYGCECLVYTGRGTDTPEQLYGNSFKYNIDVFPTHDYTRYDKELDRAKLNIVVDSKVGRNDNDFSYENGVYNLAVSKSEFKDVSDKVLYNMGNTLANAYPEEMIKYENYEISDDMIKANSEKFGDLVNSDIEPDAYQAVFVNNNTTNRFKLLSELNKNNIVLATIKIGKINPDFIYPGMPVRYVFNKKGDFGFMYGTVQAVDWYYDVPNKTTVVVIILALQKINK